MTTWNTGAMAETECKSMGTGALLVVAVYGTVPLRGGLAAVASFGLLNKNHSYNRFLRR